MIEVDPTEIRALAGMIDEFYSAAWRRGVAGALDRIAEANTGTVRRYADIATEQIVALWKNSEDDFKGAFKARLRDRLDRYFSNPAHVFEQAIPALLAAVGQVAGKMPIPLLGTALDFAAGEVAKHAHQKSIAKADEQLGAATGTRIDQFFTSDQDAIDSVKQSIEQFIAVGRLVAALPNARLSFAGAVCFPANVFDLQQCASGLAVSIRAIRQYCDGMETRLALIERESGTYREMIKTALPDFIERVLKAAYDQGVAAAAGGKTRTSTARRDNVPALDAADSMAERFAALVTHAFAAGAYSLAACRAWGVRAKNRLGEARFCRVRSVNSELLTEKPAKYGLSQAVLPADDPKSDRLLGNARVVEIEMQPMGRSLQPGR